MDTVNHRSPCEVWEGEYCQKLPYPNYQVMGSYASRPEAESALASMTVCKRDVYIVWDLVTGLCTVRPPTHREPTAGGNFLDHGEDNDRYNVMGQYGSVDEAKKAASTLGQCHPFFVVQSRHSGVCYIGEDNLLGALDPNDPDDSFVGSYGSKAEAEGAVAARWTASPSHPLKISPEPQKDERDIGLV